ncbi:hypothetical protein JXO52_17285 [bacterium]|nr:hypothetical protein [bacterium]
MHVWDYVIFAIYFLLVLGVGFYFYRRNSSREDYYVGGRSIKPSHVGMSIVATDVGGGFSIGLCGGGTTLYLIFSGSETWKGLDPSIYGIGVSLILFVSLSLMLNRRTE